MQKRTSTIIKSVQHLYGFTSADGTHAWGDGDVIPIAPVDISKALIVPKIMPSQANETSPLVGANTQQYYRFTSTSEITPYLYKLYDCRYCFDVVEFAALIKSVQHMFGVITCSGANSYKDEASIPIAQVNPDRSIIIIANGAGHQGDATHLQSGYFRLDLTGSAVIPRVYGGAGDTFRYALSVVEFH